MASVGVAPLVIVGLVILAFGFLISGSGASVQSVGIQAFAQAIARAEGFGVPGAIPTLAHNPGDLTAGDFGDTGQYFTAANGEQIIKFATDQDGWNALFQKLQNIVNGASHVYNVNMSIADLATHYAPGAQAVGWAANVAASLGVDPGALLADLLA